MSPSLTTLEPLATSHPTRDFNCREPLLDDWVKRRALASQASGASRTFVVNDGERHVLAYCALSAGALSHREATNRVRRNMPDPVPVLILGRLAVDCRDQGRQLGPAMLQDAVKRALAVADNAGVRALLVHALHERAKTFYEHYGFQMSPMHSLMLMLRLGQGG